MSTVNGNINSTNKGEKKFMATTPVSTNVESKQWIQYKELNFKVTKDLWNKKTSDNCMLAAVQHVAYKTAAVFTAVLEALQNVFYAIADVGIWAANGVHSYFADNTAEVKPPVEEQKQQVESKPLVKPTFSQRMARQYKEHATPVNAAASATFGAGLGAGLSALGYSAGYGMLAASGAGALAATGLYGINRYVRPLVVDKINAWRAPAPAAAQQVAKAAG